MYREKKLNLKERQKSLKKLKYIQKLMCVK